MRCPYRGLDFIWTQPSLHRKVGLNNNYLYHENEILYLMIHTAGITVKQTVINGISNSYKWCHIYINASCVINPYVYAHTQNLNAGESRSWHKHQQLYYEVNHNYLQCR